MFALIKLYIKSLLREFSMNHCWQMLGNVFKGCIACPFLLSKRNYYEANLHCEIINVLFWDAGHLWLGNNRNVIYTVQESISTIIVNNKIEQVYAWSSFITQATKRDVQGQLIPFHHLHLLPRCWSKAKEDNEDKNNYFKMLLKLTLKYLSS